MKVAITKDRFERELAVSRHKGWSIPRVVSGSNKPIATGNPDADNCFHIYATDAILKKVISNEKEYHLWAEHNLSGWIYSDAQKRDYEMFCSGWLQFYDLHLRKQETDHIIYFDWDTKPDWVRIIISNTQISGLVGIYLYNTPPAFSDPPPPPKPPPPFS